MVLPVPFQGKVDGVCVCVQERIYPWCRGARSAGCVGEKTAVGEGLGMELSLSSWKSSLACFHVILPGGTGGKPASLSAALLLLCFPHILL